MKSTEKFRTLSLANQNAGKPEGGPGHTITEFNCLKAATPWCLATSHKLRGQRLINNNNNNNNNNNSVYLNTVVKTTAA